MKDHFNTNCNFFLDLRRIAYRRKVTQILLDATITLKLDNCNSLLYSGLPNYLTQKLRCVQNAPAHLVSFTRKSDHKIPILFDIYWLPIEQRILFKILLITFKTLNGQAPNYFMQLLERCHEEV